jgi:hypothetical protein
MSALDDAIAAHAAHPAAAGFDPLSDSLAEQACVQPYRLQPAWENEPIEVPLPWRLGALAVVVGALLSALLGCSSLPPGFEAAKEAPPHVLASCPPLSDVTRTDRDALGLRAAELEYWYTKCRSAATQGQPAKAPRLTLPMGSRAQP